MELIDLYRQSVAAFADRVGEVRPDQWTAPTPCPDWDVRTLVNHVVSEERWSVPLFAGATIAEVGDRVSGDLLGDDPALHAAEAGEDARAAVGETGALERTIHLSFGDTPAIEYVHQLLADHVIHLWDLAVATGTERALDSEAVAVCLAWFAEREDIFRKAGAIGPRVDVPAGADPEDRLLSAYGRDPYQKGAS
jgi:uncharacterized protein (TIGR03086 family)